MTGRTRILRNLRINEVSGVDKGAGRSVKVLLMKRHPGGGTEIVSDKRQQLQEAVMENESLKRQAYDLWNEHVAEIAKRDGVSRSRAADTLQQDDVGSRLWSVIKGISAAEVAKLGGGGFTPHMPVLGGRVRSPTWNAGHGDSSNYRDPFRSTQNDAGRHDGDRETNRLRAAHERQELHDFNGAVDGMLAAYPAMPRSQAQDHVMRTHPELWEQAKKARMLPLSHDGNAGRPGYGIPRYG